MKKLRLAAIMTSLLIIGACGKIKKTEAEVERDNWVAGFSDSISYYQDRNKNIDEELERLNPAINVMLQNFEFVKNPREVSGYYVLKNWTNKIPMTTTGIYARINENEKLELIATLAGGTYNKIGVTKGSDEVFSEIVPNDQAFNFRHQRFNTVYFSGGKADTIAEFIATNKTEKLNMTFYENSNKKKNFVLPNDEKDMISETWNLFIAKKEASNLQKELWINSRKIETFRRLMDSHNNKQK